MSKKYYEFNNASELSQHLKYWSNACGELHHHGEYDLKDVTELPEELQSAYNELWEEGNGCLAYLAEFNDKYYIALISEFDNTFADDSSMSMAELYHIAKMNAIKLYNDNLFKDTILILGKETGLKECHEVIFLISAMESKNVYDEIEKTIDQNIWKIDESMKESFKNGYDKAIDDIMQIVDDADDCANAMYLLGQFVIERKYGKTS